MKYKLLDDKLHKLAQQQRKNPTAQHKFYPRVVNNTDITFSEDEMTLLEKGPKYNLHYKKKDTTKRRIGSPTSPSRPKRPLIYHPHQTATTSGNR
jgi:hypothetical protein